MNEGSREVVAEESRKADQKILGTKKEKANRKYMGKSNILLLVPVFPFSSLTLPRSSSPLSSFSHSKPRAGEKKIILRFLNQVQACAS
jgi:hypothetical protein